MRRVMVLLLGFTLLAYSKDELFIKVKVQSYDPKTGTLTVLGLSGACKGYSMKLIGKPGLNPKEMEQKEIEVLIDSSHCEDKGTYKILER